MMVKRAEMMEELKSPCQHVFKIPKCGQADKRLNVDQMTMGWYNSCSVQISI